MTKIALITGITGQDGSYLAEFLINKGYIVHGIKRRSSSFNTSRIDPLYNQYKNTKLFLHYGDLLDSSMLIHLISTIQPDEIYNLAAQSHVKVSFELPEYTSNIDGLGTLRLLEAIRIANLEKTTRFYQASSSELYGKVVETPQNEKTPFVPRSPYAVAKLYSYWIVKTYRESYGIFACNGILFNHESPRRGETFVTRKITRGVAHIAKGGQEPIVLGNLNAVRDWGHAQDYIRGMWLMLQQDVPKDYVLATGVGTTIRQFINMAFKCVNIEIEWIGSGIEEYAINRHTRHVVVRVDPIYFRPNEVDLLIGDASSARNELGWEPIVKIDELCREMVMHDMMME